MQTTICIRNYELVSPVFYASYFGLTSLLSRLLEERRSICSVYRKTLPDIDTYINAKNGRDGTALQAASAEGHEEIVRLLLDHGAEIDLTDQSALYMASQNGHEAIVQLLLQKGIEADAAGKFSKSPLEAASSRGHQGVIQLLLDHGANINAASKDRQNMDGQSALGAASSRGLEATIQFLLVRGADINANRGIALEEALKGVTRVPPGSFSTRGPESTYKTKAYWLWHARVATKS
ncbi:hypothetical protein V2G26_001955 [Clonostachys chloroleuca]